ncbi:MAG: 4Fe-4S ferredoxin [candidate division Zixibacteria bacterium HGW-Zixibacteria-1]|nr:MAG: 4Fe-4S ferredoxin [candidate division Zixibacteria bacterium HGW-Zixibacteria-1]
MKIKRRDFFKAAAFGAAAVTAGGTLGRAETVETECGVSFGVLVDTTVCIGCRKCEWACSRANSTSNRPREEYDDMSVYEKHRRPDYSAFTVVNRFDGPGIGDRKYTMKVQCMHCVDPACASACIVGALHKDKRGPVVYDAWKCIGCRYCMVACPFQVPAYEYHNPVDPQVRKCTFCYERTIEQGLPPACVAICPNEALTYGKREDLIDAAYIRIKNNPGRYFKHLYGEFEIGGTSWMYLAPVDFKYTELPRLDKEPVPHVTETIQHGIFKSFVPPLALYGLLGLVMHSLNGEKEKAEEDE